MEPTAVRYLVLSDMHFGTKESSVNDARYVGALVDRVVSRAPWEEIVLTGDLLDINLSTLTTALEGKNPPSVPGLLGFREFVGMLDSRMKQAGRGLADLAKRWIYVPGNHDYKIWDTLSARVVSDDVIARGDPMGSVATPLQKYEWQGAASFFAGVFLRFGVQGRVTVSYPNHAVSFGGRGALLLTHGHYLDASQTRGNDLARNLRGVTDPVKVKEIVRRIFIETAQYQAVANAVSFTQGTRRLVDEIVGPDGLASKLDKIFTRLGGWLLARLVSRKAAFRGQELSARHLENIDYYVDQFCPCDPRPSWFVFGHTHRQGKGQTPRHAIQVYNVGSCYPDRDMPITFLEVEAGATEGPAFTLMCVDRNANARAS